MRSVLAFFSLSLFSLASAQGAVVHNETNDGDLSGIFAAPTTLDFSTGANTIIGQIGENGNTGATDGSDADYFSFTVPANGLVTSFVVDSYVSPGNPNVSFIGITLGDGFTGQANEDVASFTFFNASSGNILPTLAGGNLIPGTYSIWIQELTSTTIDYQFTLTQIPEPSTAMLSLMGIGIVLQLSTRKTKDS